MSAPLISSSVNGTLTPGLPRVPKLDWALKRIKPLAGRVVPVAMRYLVRFKPSLERNQPPMSTEALVRFLSSIQSPVGAVELLMASLITTASGLIPGSEAPGAPPVRLLGRQRELLLNGLSGSCGVGTCPAAESRT